MKTGSDLLNKALGNIRVQLRTGQTRGKQPRPLTTMELALLQKRLCVLTAEQQKRTEERASQRLNAHVTSDADRVCSVVQATGAAACAFFESVGGAGSTLDLRLQSKALLTRAQALERAEHRQTARPAVKKSRAGAATPKACATHRQTLLTGEHGPTTPIDILPPEVGCGFP